MAIKYEHKINTDDSTQLISADKKHTDATKLRHHGAERPETFPSRVRNLIRMSMHIYGSVVADMLLRESKCGEEDLVSLSSADKLKERTELTS